MNDENTNELTSAESTPVKTPDNAEIVFLLKRLLERVDYVEKKIDKLIKRPQFNPYKERPSAEIPSEEKAFGDKPYGDKPFRGKRFSKPARSFGQSRHGGPRDRDNGSGERESGQGWRSKNRQGKKRGGPDQKKPFYLSVKRKKHS